MTTNRLIRALAVAVPLLIAACATPPPTPAVPVAPPSASAPAESSPAGQKPHKWTSATEAEVAAQLDKKFAEAAKSFVKLKRDDKVMFCKRYRDIGSMIAQLHCITEAELRKQVEDSDELRAQMRTKMGRCVLGSGCGAGPDPVSQFPLPQ